MKSVVITNNFVKIEARQPIHETKMSKSEEEENLNASFNNINEAGSSRDELLQQNQQLKEMLILQLDLIHHQQEQLAKKDKQIQLLKKEAKDLKVHIERMDRHMHFALQKFNKEKNVNLHNKIFKNNRKSSIAGLSIVCNNRRAFRSSTKRRKSQQETSDNQSSKVSKQCGTPDNALQTEDLYYIPSVKKEEWSNSTIVDDSIQIPSWRYHPVSSSYQLEGTENIDDETYNKRHFKLEMDEKRRKRWDIQRIREQCKTEKLRHGRSNSKDNQKSENAEISSFFPDPKDVLCIEVTDTVPVLAFGHPIPQFQKCDFTLPWYGCTNNKKEQPASDNDSDSTHSEIKEDVDDKNKTKEET